VEVGSKEVRVANGDRKLGEDILEGELGGFQAVQKC
jgi:hypothetical protein